MSTIVNEPQIPSNEYESIIQILNKNNCNIINYTGISRNNFIASGIGDILISLLLMKNKLICHDIYIDLFFFTNTFFFPDPINALEFRIKLINTIIIENNILNKVYYCLTEINCDHDLSFFQSNHRSLMRKLIDTNLSIPNILFDGTLSEYMNDGYIIFHTKCRFTPSFNYANLKQNLAKFYKNFKCKYKIILLGERTMPQSKEYEILKTSTIYDELCYIKNNNTVLDLTQISIYDQLDYDLYIRDINIIKNAKYNICVGHGGQYVNATLFGKKTVSYLTNIMVHFNGNCILDLNEYIRFIASNFSV